MVLISSKEDEDMVRSHLLGVNSYLQKPVSFEQFRGMVKELGLYWLLVNQQPSSAGSKKRPMQAEDWPLGPFRSVKTARCSQ